MRNYREQLKEKKRKRQRQKLKTYLNNKEKYNKTKREKRLKKNENNDSLNEMVDRQRAPRASQALINKRQKEAERKMAYRKRKKSATTDQQNINLGFKSRMAKSRALAKFKDTLPVTPHRRASLLSSYLQSKSPTINIMTESNIIQSSEDAQKVEMADALLSDVKALVDTTKKQRTKDARSTLNIVSAAMNGEQVKQSKCKIKLSKKLGVTSKRFKTGQHTREKVFKSKTASWLYTKRKTRSDAMSITNKHKIYQFWTSPEISHPTGNKADIKRVRLEPNVYNSHMKHVLIKTQEEAYRDFKTKFPDVKVSIRLFEKLKPFFVVQARPKDRATCCCKYHVEARYLFKSCMDYRRKYTMSSGFTIFETLTDLVNSTLCEKQSNGKHNIKCVNRECERCGVEQFVLSEEEIDESENANDVEWLCYEYKTIQVKNVERKKLCLVKHKTKPKIMFQYFQSILKKFAAHAFRAEWQANQLQTLKQNLPENEVIVIHDYSENYACKENVEIQSDYFSRAEVSLHVSILYRHNVPDVDGDNIDGSLVEEHFFGISPDSTHDHHFTHEIQKEIIQYLNDINYEVKTVHEWTDGCATQYKSRHCLGDLSYARQDFNCNFTRSYFETSHAKGVQDAAGGLVKKQADCAIARCEVVIQNAHDLYLQHGLYRTKNNLLQVIDPLL